MQKWVRNIFVLFFVSFLTCTHVYTQQKPVKTDSTKLYKNIESISKQSRFTKFIYTLVFKPVPKTKQIKKKVYKKLIQNPYSSFEGKIISHIHIVALDPFGSSIADETASTRILLISAVNKLHIKSHPLTIRNLLLIHQNQVFDSLLVKESERLVRSQSYVRDVSFFVIASPINSDSLDIYIRVLDNWSIIPELSGSTTNINGKLMDKNFLGMGHEFKNSYTKYYSQGDYSYNTNYFIPNIRNTYINSTVHYGNDEYRNFTKSFAIDRPFFSPFAKWAAGVNFAQEFRRDSIRTANLSFVHQRFKYNTQDFWAGYAIQLFKGNTEKDRTTSFITEARFIRIRYLIKPKEIYDPAGLYSNEDFYLTSIGISTRKYVQDKFIFRYGVKEDVPIGKALSITAGYQLKNNINRIYLGTRVSFGNYYTWGYLSYNGEFGTFFRSSHTEQGIFSASVIYFTGLMEIGKFKFRQFIKPQVTIGINRFSSDSLSLNDGYGIDGFKSPILAGTSRLLLEMQTQSYTPWNLIGFRFGPFLTCSLGALGNNITGFAQSKIYSQVGVGVLIKNDNLVINTFQFSFSFFPSIPGKGQNIFKTNSFKTTDFGFRDFELNKPSTIVFE